METKTEVLYEALEKYWRAQEREDASDENVKAAERERSAAYHNMSLCRQELYKAIGDDSDWYRTKYYRLDSNNVVGISKGATIAGVHQCYATVYQLEPERFN